MSPFSFIIFLDGGSFQAKNTITGAIEFKNLSASVVFNSVITAMYALGGGIACIRNGLYPIADKPIILKHFTGLVGEDPEKTILRSHLTTDTVFRYWQDPSSTPLEDFTLSNLKIELNNCNGNGTGRSESGTTYTLTLGKWVSEPVTHAKEINWATRGSTFAGAEAGTVTTYVGQDKGMTKELIGQVSFSFSNPIQGDNTCTTRVISGPLKVNCTMGQGPIAVAKYTISLNSPQSQSSHCDILSNLGGLDQSEIIREKLHC